MTRSTFSRLAALAGGGGVARHSPGRASSRKLDERVKILGTGELTQPLTIKAHGFSAGALAKIEAAGGTAEVIG